MCDVRRIGEGRGLCGRAGKIVNRVFLDNLRAFGINADQWTTAAQDEEEWRRTVEQGAKHFIVNGSLQRKPGLDYGMLWHAQM